MYIMNNSLQISMTIVIIHVFTAESKTLVPETPVLLIVSYSAKKTAFSSIPKGVIRIIVMIRLLNKD